MVEDVHDQNLQPLGPSLRVSPMEGARALEPILRNRADELIPVRIFLAHQPAKSGRAGDTSLRQRMRRDSLVSHPKRQYHGASARCSSVRKSVPWLRDQAACSSDGDGCTTLHSTRSLAQRLYSAKLTTSETRLGGHLQDR